MKELNPISYLPNETHIITNKLKHIILLIQKCYIILIMTVQSSFHINENL